MKNKKFLSWILCLALAVSVVLSGVTVSAAEEDKGVVLNKTATPNADGTYTIQLEAYATGSKIITETTKDVPTDIVLVLDQSGSMADNMGKTESNAYYSYGTRTNGENYSDRYNSNQWGTKNLWYKRSDGSYVSVSVSRTQMTVHEDLSNVQHKDIYKDYRNNLYILVNGQYQKVNLTRGGSKGNRNYTYTYTYNDTTICYSNDSNAYPVLNTGATDDGKLYRRNTNGYSYEYSYTVDGVETVIGSESAGENTVFPVEFYRFVAAGSTISRIDALVNAATNFVSEVNRKAAGVDGKLGTTDDIKHRIAVVGFASSDEYKNQKRYENTVLYDGSRTIGYASLTSGDDNYKNALKNMYTQEGYQLVSDSISSLATYGYTFVNLGINMASEIFKANPIPATEERNRVVIVFTDGAPGGATSGNAESVNKTAANSAITVSNQIKADHDATVYTVGIFSGADATSAGNQYATSTSADYCNWYMQSMSSNNGTPQNPSYYLSAADADTLNNIFEQIASNIESGGSTSSLTAEAVIKDIIAPSFTLPADVKVSDIILETYACTGKDGDEYIWQNNNSNMNARAEIIDSQVNVTGFNFSENFVGTVTQGDKTTYRGHKLVIKFKVVPKTGFLGGNNVPTNTEAAIYENENAEKPVDFFPVPTVNVKVQTPKITVPDYNVYLMGGVDNTTLLNNATVTVIGTDGNPKTLDFSAPNYGLESWQNAYATVGNPSSGTAVYENMEQDADYTVTVDITPKETTSNNKYEPVSGTSASATGHINVFVPTLTFQDSYVDYKSNINETSYVNKGSSKVYETNNFVQDATVWKHNDTLSTTVSMIGTEPALTRTYVTSNGVTNGKVTATTYVPVNVSVAINGEDVSDKCTFAHNPCNKVNCEWTTAGSTTGKPAFLLHIDTIPITIKKVVDGNMGDWQKMFTFEVSGAAEDVASFKLKHEGTKTILASFGNTITITEKDKEGYKMSATGGKDGEVENAKGDTSTYTFTVDSNTTEIVITNTKTATIDTGVMDDTLPFVIIFAVVALAGVLLILNKRRYRGIY